MLNLIQKQDAQMREAYIDFETFYSTEYSLSRMTAAEYITHHQFEELGAAVAFDDEDPVWLEDEALANWLSSCATEPTIVFSHNALFDAVIMSWRHGLNPALWGDTLAMARGVLSGKLQRFSLAKVSEYLGLGVKGDTIVNLRGINKLALRADPRLYAECKEYACNDLVLCRGIRRTLAPEFPRNEYLVVDTLIRAVTEPLFTLDQNIVYEHLHAIQARKEELLNNVGLDSPAALMSNNQFAAALEQLGVEPPMKVSKTTGLETYAFAKTDKAIDDLLEHEDPRVQALVAARLGHKSTQEETRSARFISVANASNGLMVMPLKYSGAHTHRFSGDWKMNVQNLGRTSPLRRALKAPPGYKVVAVDASQIEARFGAWLADWDWLLDQFRDPTQDPYSNYASQLFQYPVTRANKMERFVGKQSILSLQYGASWKAFQRMCRTMGGLEFTEAQTGLYVAKYRSLAQPITELWKVCGGLIKHMQDGTYGGLKCVFTRKDELRLPSGLAIRYPGLWYERVDRTDVVYKGTAPKFSGYRYGDGISIFGGKLMENICQALARIVVTDAGNRIRLNHGISYKLQVHDELVYIVPDEQAEWLRDEAIKELSVTPSWAPNLPLAAEGGIGDNYGECK